MGKEFDLDILREENFEKLEGLRKADFRRILMGEKVISVAFFSLRLPAVVMDAIFTERRSASFDVADFDRLHNFSAPAFSDTSLLLKIGDVTVFLSKGDASF